MPKKETYMVVIGDDVLRTMRIQGMLHSYNTILRAYMVYSDNMPYISEDITTVVHIDNKEKIQAIMHTMPYHVRYIGLVDGTDEIMGSSVGYVAIPVPNIQCTIPTTMYPVPYPNVPLSPNTNMQDLNQYKSFLGREIEYQYSKPVQTKTVVAHPVILKGEAMHITRGVVYGQAPNRSILEMEQVKGESYTTSLGYPVIM